LRNEAEGLKRILYLTGYPAPYRVAYFDVLGRDADVTVLFADRKEDQTHRSQAWFVQGSGNFRAVQLEKRVSAMRGGCLCLDVVDWLKQKWDVIVLCGYSSPTVMLAMAYLKARRIPFWMEVDGGLIRPDSKAKYLFKKTLVRSAAGWLSTGKSTTDYLVHYGAVRERVYEYPFSSLHASDFPETLLNREEKMVLRRELGISDGKMILSIGQFIYRKGYDVLLRCAAMLAPDVEIYIVGGTPTEEYLQMCRDLKLQNVHFEGFMKKEQLLKYYQAADLFVLPTREDIWGLVINEAMAYGLPVVTTDRCVAGLDLVENDTNGYIVPVGDEKALAEKIGAVFAGDWARMGQVSREKIQPYTIEMMAKKHLEIFEEVTLY